MAESAKADQDWFENVENLRPLRGGRRAGTLNDVATGTIKITVEEAERKFLKEFANAATKEDPLDSMSQYVTWFEEHFPSGKQKYFYPILYKICTTYGPMNNYKNDERLLKIWMKLVENFPESGLAVMEFAFTKDSCRQLAKFYINWSEMYQSFGWWNKAREKLQLGLKMGAIPLDLLHQASDELESRVMRATCQQQLSFAEEELDEADLLEVAREKLARLRGIGRHHFAPILRVPKEPAGILNKTCTEKKPNNLDRFEIFSDDQQQCTTSQHCLVFQTPIGPPRMKNSRIAEQLVDDLNYQALFGKLDEKLDLQITNEENDKGSISGSLLPGISTQNQTTSTGETDAFDIYQDDQRQEDAINKKDGKAKLKLKKELIRELSVEEAMVKRITEASRENP